MPPIPCLRAVCIITVSLTGKALRWRDREPFYMQATLSF